MISIYIIAHYKSTQKGFLQGGKKKKSVFEEDCRINLEPFNSWNSSETTLPEYRNPRRWGRQGTQPHMLDPT